MGFWSSWIHGLTSKSTPVNADEIPLIDTEASNVGKKLTLTNLKAFLKTYFDGLYGTGSGDVVGPASAVDSNFAGFNTTTGKLIKDSGSKAADFATAGHNHDASYAPLAKGVTNGDSHDHNGGDGAQIAYSSLSGTPTLGTAASVNTGTTNGTIPLLGSGDKLANTLLPAATDTASGISELATAAETTTGTDAARVVTPDGLAGSAFGVRVVQIAFTDPATDLATGDGKAYFVVPSELNGYNLVGVSVDVITAGTTNASTFDVYNVTDATTMLTGNISIASGNTSAAGTIDTAHDDVATGDRIRLDVDALSTTKPKGGVWTMKFQLP